MAQGLEISLVLFITAAMGFWLGWRQHQKHSHFSQKVFAHSYYRGMSYLLNEQIDSSVDKFIDSLAVNSETLEIHLALGNLMRRKGEAAKAIQIHQNLLECKELTQKQQYEAQLELARDYVNAGLLDRAESLFLELVALDSHYSGQALEHLVEIYQDEKEWRKAIQMANVLTKKAGGKNPRELAVASAHYCCELALLAVEAREYTAAKQHLTCAFDFDRSSVRASLIAAEMAVQLQEYDDALHVLQGIPQQDPELISTSLPLLCRVYQCIGDTEREENNLIRLLDSHPSNELVIKIAECLSARQNEYVAAEFIAEQLKKRPSIKALTKLVELHLLHSVGKAKENLQMLKQLVDKVIAEKPGFHCLKCGFTGNRLHWLCPGCKTWSSIKPIRGVAGD